MSVLEFRNPKLIFQWIIHLAIELSAAIVSPVSAMISISGVHALTYSVPGFTTSCLLQFGSFAFAVAAWFVIPGNGGRKKIQ